MSRRAAHAASVHLTSVTLYLNNLLLQFKWARATSRRQLQEGSSSCLIPVHLSLLLLGPETPGKSFLPLRRKRNGARSERVAGRVCKVCSARHGHSAVITSSLSCHRWFLLFFSFQRHSSGKSSTLSSNLGCSRTPGNKGWGLSILSLLTIAVLKFQLWNLFCATTWNRDIGAVPKFGQL